MVLARGSHFNSKQWTVSFLCKLCGGSFSSVNKFLKHKWTLHASQFPNFDNATNNMIVFQEIISNQEGSSANGSTAQNTAKFMNSETDDDGQCRLRNQDSKDLRLFQTDLSVSGLTWIKIPTPVLENTGELAIASSSNYDGGKVFENQTIALPATVITPKSVNKTIREKQDNVATLDNEKNISKAHHTGTGTGTGIARGLVMPETKSKSAFSGTRQIKSTTNSLRNNKILLNPCVLVKRLTFKEIMDQKGINSELKSPSKKIKPSNFICPHPSCSFSYRHKYYVIRHFKIVHAKLKQFKCTHPGCPKWFSTKGNCQNHAVVHTSTRYTCDVCKRNFVYKCSLKTHYALLHTPTTKLFECPFSGCHKSFMTKGSLKCHLPIHMDVRSRPTFECKVCKKQMLRKPYLRQHYLKCHGRSSLHNFYAPAQTTTTEPLRF